jgi:hypothetical protein
MTTSGAFVCLVLLLVAASCTTSSVSAAPTANSQGIVDCFAQILAASLTRLSLNNDYVCTLSKNGVLLANGDMGTAAFNAFGPNHGFPLLQSEDAAFFESYYGTPTDGFVAVARVNITSNSGIGYYMTNATQRVSYFLDEFGQLTGDLNAVQEYVPTSRIWYQGALNSTTGSYVTATPYRFSLNSLRVTASRQCISTPAVKRDLQVIAGADITLDVLSEAALTNAKCPLFNAAQGVVFVVNADGVLLMQNGAGVTGLAEATASAGLVGAAARYAKTKNGADWYGKTVAETFTYADNEYEVVTYPVSSSLTASVDLSAWGWTVVSVQSTSGLCGTSSAASSLLPFRFFM